MDRPPPLRRRSFSHFTPLPESTQGRRETGAAGRPPDGPHRSSLDRIDQADQVELTARPAPDRRLERPAPPNPAPPPACHARARQRLYRAIDHLTFRGALIPLVSSLMKLGTSAISGQGALRHTLLAAASSSAAQTLLGAASSGDREHGYTWVSTLAPSRALAPPPSVAHWGLCGSPEDQRRLATIDHWRAAIDTGRIQDGAPPGPGRAGLDQLAGRLHALLRAERNQADGLAGLVAMVVVLLDGMVAARARQDADAGRLDSGPCLVILVHMGLSLLLDAAACHWQMQMRSPSSASYPRPPLPALSADVIAPRRETGGPSAAPELPVRPLAIDRPPGQASARRRGSEVKMAAGLALGVPLGAAERVFEEDEGGDSDLESGSRVAPLPLRGWARADGPAAPPAPPDGGPGPAADRSPPCPR